MLKVSTGELQSCCDMNTSIIDMIKIATIYLQSEIDAIVMMSTVSLVISLIDQ